MTHTPGPWDNSITTKYTSTGDEIIIPCVYKQLDGGQASMFICEMGGNNERDYANARLIAAAPDMLEAAKLALTELDRIGSDIGFEPERYQERIHALDALSRAVRKAEGE